MCQDIEIRILSDLFNGSLLLDYFTLFRAIDEPGIFPVETFLPYDRMRFYRVSDKSDPVAALHSTEWPSEEVLVTSAQRSLACNV